MPQKVRLPIAVALAERFLWEVMLTCKWDHIFLGDENTGLPVLPREISFCPTVRSWHEAISDGKIILYSDPSTCSTVTIGMRREKVSGSDVWYPNYISFSLEIVDNDLREKLGLLSRLITSDIVVWNEK